MYITVDSRKVRKTALYTKRLSVYSILIQNAS